MKERIEQWLDANVWDGDKLSHGTDCDSHHKATFTPHELTELVIDCLESLRDCNK